MHARYACCLSYRVSPAASLFSVAALLFLRPSSFLTVVFFFPPRFCLTEWSERLPRELVYFPIERRSTEHGARWLPPKGRPNGPTWRDRISIFHRARLRITCPCAPHANGPFAYLDEFVRARRLENYMPRATCGYCKKYIVLLIGWSFLRSTGKGEERTLVWFITPSTLWEDSRAYLV